MKDKRTRKTILNRLKTVDCKLQAIIDACDSDEIIIADGLTAMQMSTLTENYFDFYQPHSNTHVPVDRTVYHNGMGAYPTFGDIIYTDPQGTVPLVNTNGQQFYLGMVDALGVGVDEYFLDAGGDSAGGFTFLETAAGFDSNG